MATTNSNLTFTASPVYAFLPEANSAAIHDQLTARLGQLSAMLLSVIGDGFQNFSAMNSDNQENYLWACRMIASECKELADKL